MKTEFIVYPFLFVVIGLFLLSFFLIWHWFDAREQLHIVRADTREKTLKAMKKGHNKCRAMLLITLIVALAYIPVPLHFHTFFGTLVYPAVVFGVNILILVLLRSRAKEYESSIDDFIAANEAHVQEAAEARARERRCASAFLAVQGPMKMTFAVGSVRLI